MKNRLINACLWAGFCLAPAYVFAADMGTQLILGQ